MRLARRGNKALAIWASTSSRRSPKPPPTTTWVSCANPLPRAIRIRAEIAKLRLHAFQGQDEPMMEAIQEMLGVNELLKRQPVLFNVDTGPVRMMRVLEQLLAKETPADGGR
jgi:hypothetical protein